MAAVFDFIEGEEAHFGTEFLQAKVDPETLESSVDFALANSNAGDVRGGEGMHEERDFFTDFQIETPDIQKG